jgi:hypothetical protein
MEVFIYKLIDPVTREIRYAGKTISIEKRIYSHVRDSKKAITHTHRWIQSLIEKSLKPAIEIIEITDEINWPKREIYWIARLKVEGHRLTNHNAGGNGLTRRLMTSEETREKLRKARLGKKGVKIRPENFAKMVKLAVIANTKHSLETRIKVQELCKSHQPNVSGNHSASEVAAMMGLTVSQVRGIKCSNKRIGIVKSI